MTDDRRWTAFARDATAGADNTVWVSVASIWEIAIKYALGRGGIPFPVKASIGYVEQAGYQLLAVRPEHAAAVESSPMLHNDPFDRMLIAQAITEPLRLRTHDRALAAYSDTIILV